MPVMERLKAQTRAGKAPMTLKIFLHWTHYSLLQAELCPFKIHMLVVMILLNPFSLRYILKCLQAFKASQGTWYQLDVRIAMEQCSCFPFGVGTCILVILSPWHCCIGWRVGVGRQYLTSSVSQDQLTKRNCTEGAELRYCIQKSWSILGSDVDDEIRDFITLAHVIMGWDLWGLCKGVNGFCMWKGE